MYLSTLLIDTGENPDRPRPGRLWLRNPYRVHQRLCMAFPSRARKGDDPEMLRPYREEDFACGHVHRPRGGDAGFLFRIDPKSSGRAAIVVLSAAPPDWDYAFHNARYLLAAQPVEPHPLAFDASVGAAFRFRLVANPTKRPPLTKDQWRQKKALGEHVKRPRVQLTWNSDDEPSSVFRQWLVNKADRCGFKVLHVEMPHIGYVYISKGSGAGVRQRLRSVRYEGRLEVTDHDRFHQALASGIGPAKAFGFGLLSLAPLPVSSSGCP